MILASILLSLLLTLAGSATDEKPNIIFFLTDDWGFNDVGYYGNTDTMTPFIDTIVQKESLRIDRHYVLPECTVTRCALLTGRYPMRYGMQDDVLYYTSPYALSNYEYLMSNEFQSQGYRTHLVGKWHLGFRSWDYTPTYRGFDTFLGFYMGLMYYYSHYGLDNQYASTIDFHLNENDYDEYGVYSLEIYRNRINDLLKQEASSDGNEPFFIYVGWQGSHNPSEAPSKYLDLYPGNSSSSSSESDDSSDDNNNDNDDNNSDTDNLDSILRANSENTNSALTANAQSRRYFQAQTTATDDMFQDIVTQLKTLDLWDNTLVVFASDNGGAYGFGDNSPLRGSKFTLWEGGVRVPAFITGGYLPENKRGKVFDKHMMHVTDWYQTLVSGVAKLDVQSSNDIDGVNMWDYLMQDGDAADSDMAELAERYVLLNVDSRYCDTEDNVCGALIYGGRWKIVVSSNQLRSKEGTEVTPESCFWHRTFAADIDNDKILECGSIPSDVDAENECPCTSTACLFDLENDPCEYYDVSEDYPDMLSALYDKLTQFYEEQTMPLSRLSPSGYIDINPEQFYNGSEQTYWTPWDTTDWKEIEFEKILASNYIKTSDDDDEMTKNVINLEKKGSKTYMIDNSEFLVFLISACSVFMIFFGLTYYCLRKTMNDSVTIKTVYDNKTEISPLIATPDILRSENTYQSV